MLPDASISDTSANAFIFAMFANDKALSFFTFCVDMPTRMIASSDTSLSSLSGIEPTLVYGAFGRLNLFQTNRPLDELSYIALNMSAFILSPLTVGVYVIVIP